MAERKKLIDKRKENFKSQQQIADFAEVDVSYISKIENGSSNNFSFKKAKKIGLALGYNIDPEGIFDNPDDK